LKPIDDAAARKYARQQQLKFTGMVGVVLAAKQTGIISLARPQLDALIAVGIFIDTKLYQQACRSVGE
jgi:predicted nucleic acid-binding protein